MAAKVVNGVLVNELAMDAFAVTLSDSDQSEIAWGFYVGSAGDLKITTADGTALTLEGLTACTFVPIAVKRFWLTGSTAGIKIVGLR